MTNPITINATETDSYTLVDINIESGTCEPADIKTLNIPTVKGNKGVVLNGRAPIWLPSLYQDQTILCKRRS